MIKSDLTTKEGRIQAIEELNTNFIKAFKQVSPEQLQRPLMANINNNSISIQGVDEKNIRIWASEVTIYGKDEFFGGKVEKISYGTTGSFNPTDPSDINSVIRTELAYHIVQNWENIIDVINTYIGYWKDLGKEIEEANQN